MAIVELHFFVRPSSLRATHYLQSREESQCYIIQICPHLAEIL